MTRPRYCHNVLCAEALEPDRAKRGRFFCASCSAAIRMGIRRGSVIGYAVGIAMGLLGKAVYTYVTTGH